MVQFIPPPDSRRLLPPLLACLPTAFVSPRPPPALLPLLSPILRQRVQLLAATASPSESWLPLLCWDAAQAEKLASTVEGEAFDQHPVSGEIEFEDVTDIKYRRLDGETLHARLVVPGLDLVVMYLWCQGDQEGAGDGWRVSEVAPVDNQSDGASGNWYPSIPEAEQQSYESNVANVLGEGSNRKPSVQDLLGLSGNEQDLGDDDDDYWAQYDDALARSLKPEQSVTANGILNPSEHEQTSDAEYFARYRNVQPEMDNDDPSEDPKAVGESSLNGNVLMDSLNQVSTNGDPNALHIQKIFRSLEGGNDESEINQPAASSPSAASFTISRLEGSAATQSHYEVAIRQHISTSIKSLFRLTRNAGIDRVEFEELVRTELATLSLMEEDD